MRSNETHCIDHVTHFRPQLNVINEALLHATINSWNEIRLKTLLYQKFQRHVGNDFIRLLYWPHHISIFQIKYPNSLFLVDGERIWEHKAALANEMIFRGLQELECVSSEVTHQWVKAQVIWSTDLTLEQILKHCELKSTSWIPLETAKRAVTSRWGIFELIRQPVWQWGGGVG